MFKQAHHFVIIEYEEREVTVMRLENELLSRMRTIIVDGVAYKALPENEYKEILLKEELERNHEKLLNGEIKEMSIEEFEAIHRAKYEL